MDLGWCGKVKDCCGGGGESIACDEVGATFLFFLFFAMLRSRGWLTGDREAGFGFTLADRETKKVQRAHRIKKKTKIEIRIYGHQ